MRKGEEKRQELLNVAEHLFCTKGYDATSVQDLLDVLHTSKGGFYHHFSSKESVLDTLCEQRAEKYCQDAEQAMSEELDPIARLNILLHHMLPLRMEELSFFSMLLPMLSRPEGLPLRVRYQETLSAAFAQVLEREIQLGIESDVMHPVARGIIEPVLHLVNACWADAAALLIASSRTADRQEPAAILAVLDKYRRSIEVLLDAPYGTIVLIELEEWTTLSEKLIRRLRMPLR